MIEHNFRPHIQRQQILQCVHTRHMVPTVKGSLELLVHADVVFVWSERSSGAPSVVLWLRVEDQRVVGHCHQVWAHSTEADAVVFVQPFEEMDVLLLHHHVQVVRQLLEPELAE
jgi:hypothetical protein